MCIILILVHKRPGKEKKTQNTKTMIFRADSPRPCGARASPKQLPFRDVHDVGVPA